MRIWILAFCGIACLLAPACCTADNVTQLVAAVAKLQQPVVVVTNSEVKLPDIERLFENQFRTAKVQVLTIGDFIGHIKYQKWQLTFYVVFTEEDKAIDIQPWCPASWDQDQQKGIFAFARCYGEKARN